AVSDAAKSAGSAQESGERAPDQPGSGGGCLRPPRCLTQAAQPGVPSCQPSARVTRRGAEGCHAGLSRGKSLLVQTSDVAARASFRGTRTVDISGGFSETERHGVLLARQKPGVSEKPGFFITFFSN